MVTLGLPGLLEPCELTPALLFLELSSPRQTGLRGGTDDMGGGCGEEGRGLGCEGAGGGAREEGSCEEGEDPAALVAEST